MSPFPFSLFLVVNTVYYSYSWHFNKGLIRKQVNLVVNMLYLSRGMFIYYFSVSMVIVHSSLLIYDYGCFSVTLKDRRRKWIKALIIRIY